MTVITDEIIVEVLLIHGTVFNRDNRAGNYWEAVWEYLYGRYPELFHQPEYPSARGDSYQAEDLEQLNLIYEWQKNEHYKGGGR